MNVLSSSRHRKRILIAGLVLALTVCAVPQASRAQDPGAADDGGSAAAHALQRMKRRWKIMVLVPEQHLARPRIPDPAVETELRRQLIDSGYKVIDQERMSSIRYNGVVDRIVAGGPDASKEAAQLMRKFGADVLVTGEAFTQEQRRGTVNSDLGPVTEVQCRSRVELRAIRMDTGEVFFSDALHKTGTGEPTEELASKICLEQTAEDIAPLLLRKLDGVAVSSTQTLELQIRGLGNASRGTDLEEALSHLSGVVDVSPGDLDGGTYDIEIEIEKSAIRDLKRALETNTTLQPFHLKVQSASGSKIIVNSDSKGK